MTYDEWIKQEALAVRSDGCTAVDDWNLHCCWEHDLSLRYDKDPRDAYRLFQDGHLDPWPAASRLSRRDADYRFWRCNRTKSPSLWGRLRADLRFLGVRIVSIISRLF